MPYCKARERSREKGERSHEKNGVRIDCASRQTCRLFGEEPRTMRNLPRGRGFRRRHGETGQRQKISGDPAPSRQDPERGENACEPRARKRGDQGDDHGVRRRHARRFRRDEDPLRPRDLHDRCRCRRIAYQNSSAHVLLPLYASPCGTGARVHRAAAFVQSDEEQGGLLFL